MFAIGKTDTGKTRAMNQDSFYVDVANEENCAILAVCDGMGGASSGNVASSLAIDVFVSSLHNSLSPGMDIREIRSVLRDATDQANQKIYQQALSHPEYYGMGTTLVGAVIVPDIQKCADMPKSGTIPLVAVFANVGDSRAYIIDHSGIERITRDHSVVEDLFARGEISREEAKIHPSKNLITRALGTEPTVKADVFSIDLHPGDTILLCSDGITNTIEEMEILYEVTHSGSSCPERLIQLANDRGGPDNSTVIITNV